MKRKNVLLYGIISCLVITLLFTGLYVYTTHSVQSMDLKNVETIKDENIVFMIDSINDEKKIYSIYGVARNENLKYTYSNWVNGEGENVYKNFSIVLVDEKENVLYKLKTYVRVYGSSNEEIHKYSSNGDGFVAYAPLKFVNKKYRIAVVFENRENHMYIFYPKEEVTL